MTRFSFALTEFVAVDIVCRERDLRTRQHDKVPLTVFFVVAVIVVGSVFVDDDLAGTISRRSTAAERNQTGKSDEKESDVFHWFLFLFI